MKETVPKLKLRFVDQLLLAALAAVVLWLGFVLGPAVLLIRSACLDDRSGVRRDVCEQRGWTVPKGQR